MIELSDLDFKPTGPDRWDVIDRRLKQRLGWMQRNSDGSYAAGGVGAMFAGPTKGAATRDEAAQVFLGYE